MAKATAMKGGDLMVWINGSVIPLSTSCTLNDTTEVVDPETKDDGIYPEIDPDGDKWSVQCEAQLTQDLDIYSMLKEAYDGHTSVPLKIGVPTNKSNNGLPAAGWTAPSAGYFSGNAYISALGSAGDKKNKATCSVTFSGCSELSFTAPVSQG